MESPEPKSVSPSAAYSFVVSSIVYAAIFQLTFKPRYTGAVLIYAMLTGWRIGILSMIGAATEKVVLQISDAHTLRVMFRMAPSVYLRITFEYQVKRHSPL